MAVFFFQAEDGIRDDLVTGVQTCALPISRPIVVCSPWPDHTTVSPGKLNNTSRIDRRKVSMLPPGKSVRPIDPANSVSPTNSVAFCSPSLLTASQTPPGQCPGAWTTRTEY